MKKSILVSSVAAFAVVSVLSLSGCGGNSGTDNSNPNTFKKSNIQDSEQKSIKISDAGESEKIQVAIKKDGHDKNPITFTLKNVTGTKNGNGVGAGKSCEEAAKVNDPCEVVVQAKCENETVDGRKNPQGGFSVLTQVEDSVYHDSNEWRYGGSLVNVTKDDIDSCNLYIAVDFDCVLGKDGRGVYVNSDTAPEGSNVMVIVTDKDGVAIAHKIAKLKYHDDAKHHAYVSFEDGEGVPLNGHGLSDVGEVHFYIDMKTNIPDPHDVWSGATGGSGATGAGA